MVVSLIYTTLDSLSGQDPPDYISHWQESVEDVLNENVII